VEAEEADVDEGEGDAVGDVADEAVAEEEVR